MINLRFRTRMAFVTSVFTLAFVMDLRLVDGQMCTAETIPTFPCAFGYSCMVGRKPYKSMGIFTDRMVDTLPFFEINNINGHYCDCEEYEVKPDHGGMTDVTCNTMFFRCPDNLICFHGAPCKYDDDSYICDCSRSKNGFNLTLKGEHCEYQVDVDEKEEITDLLEDNDVITNPVCHPDDANDATGLACESGYKCRVGEKDYKSMSVFTKEMVDTIPLFQIDNLDGRYCDCEEDSIGRGKSGMTGVSCNATFTRCGNDVICLHGAACKYAGKEKGYMCDCAHTSSADKTYMGKHCELQHKTSYCPAPPGSDPEDYYCSNGSRCPENSWDWCLCNADYTGPRCEFLAQDYKECNLQCINGGACFFGDQPTTNPYDDLGIKPVSNMHCRCPDGYVGPHCETEIDRCFQSKNYCLNGGTCVQKGGDYTCECPLDALVPYAGDHCQHIATVICEGRFKNFCTNNGKCGKDVGSEDNINRWCTCDDGLDGRYCEHDKETTKKSTRRYMLFTIIISIITLSMFMIIHYGIKRHNKKESEDIDASVDVDADAPAGNDKIHNSELL